MNPTYTAGSNLLVLCQPRAAPTMSRPHHHLPNHLKTRNLSFPLRPKYVQWFPDPVLFVMQFWVRGRKKQRVRMKEGKVRVCGRESPLWNVPLRRNTKLLVDIGRALKTRP